MKSWLMVAIGFVTLIIAGCTTQSTLQQSHTAEQSTQTANDLFLQGKYEEAVPEFDIAIRMNPDNPENHYGRGTALLRLNRNQKALKDFDFLISKRYDFPGLDGLGTNVRLSRAQVYLRMGYFIRAIDDCTIAIKNTRDVEVWASQRGSLDLSSTLRRNLIDAYLLRAAVYSKLGNRTKSKEDEDNATKIEREQR